MPRPVTFTRGVAKRFLSVLVILGIFGGCNTGPWGGRLYLTHDGLSRSYIVHRGAGERPEGGWPVVIALHPFAGTGPGMARRTGFNELADREGFLACYPEGVTFLWNGDPTDGSKSILVEDADDVGYLSALIDRLVSHHGADPERIYVAGASNGGLMAQRLACELGDKLAAVASVMITLPEGFPERYPSTVPTPAMIIFGTEDPFFPWEGGAVQQGPNNASRYLSAGDSVGFWVERNGASPVATVTELPDSDPADGTRVTREYHAAEEVGGAEVVFYAIEGGGHTWPGSATRLLERIAGVGRTSQDLKASATIWDFFKRHERRGAADRASAGDLDD